MRGLTWISVGLLCVACSGREEQKESRPLSPRQPPPSPAKAVVLPRGLTSLPQPKAMALLGTALGQLRRRLELNQPYKETALAVATMAGRIPPGGVNAVRRSADTAEVIAWARDLAMTPPATRRRSYNKLVQACVTCHMHEAPSQVASLRKLILPDPWSTPAPKALKAGPSPKGSSGLKY